MIEAHESDLDESARWNKIASVEPAPGLAWKAMDAPSSDATRLPDRGGRPDAKFVRE